MEMKTLFKFKNFYSIVFLILILLFLVTLPTAAKYFRSNLANFVKSEGQITVPIFAPKAKLELKTQTEAVLIGRDSDKFELEKGKSYFISQSELEALPTTAKTKKTVWGVQLLASSEAEKAAALKKELKALLGAENKIEFLILNEADLYKLVAGNYEQRKKAEKLKERFEAAGYNSWPRQFEIESESVQKAVSPAQKLQIKKEAKAQAETKSLNLYNSEGEKLKEAYTFKLKGDFQIESQKLTGDFSFGPLGKSVLFSYKTDLEELTAYLLQKYCSADTAPTALKAQAIIYRTNLLYQLEVKGARLTNLTQLDFEPLKPVFREAAAATKAQVLTKDQEFYYNKDFSLKNIKKPKAGLIALARADYNYREIINYYYKRSKIEDLNQLLDSEQTIEARIKRGLKFKEIRQLTWSGPRVLTVLDLDLNNDYLKLKPVLAQGKTLGREDLKALIKKHSALAGVNGGYFDGQGTPLGLVYLAGELVSEPLYKRSSLLIGPDNQISFAQVDWAGKLIIGQNDFSVEIDGINRRPNAYELIVFNHYYGSQMPPLAKGQIDLVIRNNKFLGLEDQAGLRSPIPKNGFILRVPAVESLSKKLKKQVLALKNKEFNLEYNFNPNLEEMNILSALGGGPRLLKNGKIDINGKAENFKPDILTGRAPRTAVGLSADNHLLLLTIDGRQSDLSVGMSLKELAKTLKDLGAVEAINLDGGGSARMVIRGFTMSNPSEKRLISNGVIVGPDQD